MATECEVSTIEILWENTGSESPACGKHEALSEIWEGLLIEGGVDSSAIRLHHEGEPLGIYQLIDFGASVEIHDDAPLQYRRSFCTSLSIRDPLQRDN